MSSLGKRVGTGTTLAAAVAALLWLHPFLPAGMLSLGVVSVLAFLSAWELDRMGSFGGRGGAWLLYPAATLQVLLAGFLLLADPGHGAGPQLAALYAGAGLFCWPRGILGERTRPARAFGPLALWLLPPLFSIVLIDREFGTRGLVALVVLAKAGDNAGYFVGRAIGKRHPFPRISPGKTVAGCVASLLAGTAAGAVLLPATLGEWNLPQAALGALLGALLNVAAQAGDLSESWVKRRAGVKDSSALLGPSGGVLDVIDSLLLAAPVALVAWSLAYGDPLPRIP
jgi:phosphatidate cytidylyltransferase